MASYTLNERGVARARRLIDARQYVLDSDWGDAQPRADTENAFLASRSWDEYAEWHLGLTDGASGRPRRGTPSSMATSVASTGLA